MYKLVFVCLLALASAKPPKFPKAALASIPEPQPAFEPEPAFEPQPAEPHNSNYKPHDFEVQQNRAAKYEFSSDIDDKISDLTHRREETRDGLNVKGSYTYSDGYYQRTVFYEADDKGYRVVKQEAAPLPGPQVDLTGTASVATNAHGRTVSYRVQSVPEPGPVARVITEA